MISTLAVHLAAALLIGVGVAHLVGSKNQSSVVDVVLPTVAGLITAGFAAALDFRVRRKGPAWKVRRYRVADRPAIRYESKKGHYIKFERYEDGVSANWSTVDGPQVLLSIPLQGAAPVGQFWTSEAESDQCRLTELAPDLLRNKSDVIRAWVETDRELIVWRLADPRSAGIAQLGVLMRSWNPRRVQELVGASATKPIKGTVSNRLKAANSLMR
jgi:hypothetical protein